MPAPGRRPVSSWPEATLGASWVPAQARRNRTLGSRDIGHSEILQYGVGVGISFRAVEAQAAPDDQVQSRQFAQFAGANVFTDLGRKPPGAQGRQRFQSGGAGEHFEQHDPERVEVGTGIGWKPRQLLRRHIARGAAAFTNSAEAKILGQARSGQTEIAERGFRRRCG